MIHSRFVQLALAAAWLALPACHSQAADPPPPPASYELAVAPPGARGARAAGTDAAPAPPTEGEIAEPGAEVPDEPEPEDDGGAAQDGGGLAPDAGPGVAL